MHRTVAANACRLDTAIRAITDFSRHGYRVRLAGGTYTGDLYLNGKAGTQRHPLVLQPELAAGDYPRIEGSIEVNGSSYVYFLGAYKLENDRRAGSVHALTLGPAGLPLHISCSNHVLVRQVEITGGAPPSVIASETVKVNQATNIYIEKSSIHGAVNDNGNAIDLVAVQDAAVLDNELYDTADWCIYAKGGSHDISIEGNTIHDCGFHPNTRVMTSKGGVSAGEGTDFPYAVRPFLKYQVSAIRVLNNVIYETAGAAINVQGAFNAIFAFNTMYDVAQNREAGSPLIGIEYGLVNCNAGQTDCNNSDIHDLCDTYQREGGWGPTTAQGADGREIRIPNKHVFIVSNVIYNGRFGTRDAHMTIAGGYTGTVNEGTPAPLNPRGDEDLRIFDNLIWNGVWDRATRTVGSAPAQVVGSPVDAPGAAPDLDGNVINQTMPVPMFPRMANAIPVGDRCMLREGDGGDPINCVAAGLRLPDMVWDDAAPLMLPPPATGLRTQVSRNHLFVARRSSRPGAW